MSRSGSRIARPSTARKPNARLALIEIVDTAFKVCSELTYQIYLFFLDGNKRHLPRISPRSITLHGTRLLAVQVMATTFEVLYLGNVAALDPTEGNTTSENAGSIVGTTFGSAGAPLAYGSQRVLSAVDISSGDPTQYNKDNNVANDTFSIDGGPAQTFDTLVIYNATIHYTDGTPDATATLMLFQDTDGNLYLAPEPSNNADAAALAAAPIESVTINSISTDSSWMVADRFATDFVCFAPGSLIRTVNGDKPVETLRPGDLVMTVDHGPQPVRWVRSSDHPLEDAEVDDKPVLIQAGALGAGRPAQDLIVSPQHRILVGGGGQLTGYFAAEAFAPAKALTGLPGIRHMKGRSKITWVHFACDRHEVVIANECYSENLLLGPMVLNGLSRSERAVLTDIYGPAFGNRAGLNGPAIRDCLKAGEVRRHLAKRKESQDRHRASEIKKWDIDLAREKYEADRLRKAVV